MADEPTIGENLARLRAQTGLTQQELSTKSGVSVAAIRVLERNGRTTALMGTLAKLARALDVRPQALLGQPQTLRQEEGHRASVAALRRSVLALDEVPGVPLAVTADGESAPAVDELSHTVGVLWRQYHHGEFSGLVAGLPGLLGGAKAAVREARGSGRRAASAELSRAYQVAAMVAVHLSQDDLARSALEKAMVAADKAEDQLLIAAGCNALSWVLLRQGEPGLAAQLAVGAAEELNPRMAASDYAALRMWGRLMLSAVTAASRQEDFDGAAELLASAKRCTKVVRTDRMDYVNGGHGSAFGPSKVSMVAVELAMAQGHPGEALRLAKKVPPTRRLPPATRGRHLLDVAQAQTWEARFTEAVATLTRVQAMAGEWMRYQVLARDTVQQIFDNKGRRRIDGLAPLAEHMSITMR
ncbi:MULTISPECIES: helix-turn-helix domain-containing protein [Streptomyces]|uniref:helix-turn-helix domain-containing protein n=1 Tax=Streptomyces TaxID=1883 RepID=UPI00345B5078